MSSRPVDVGVDREPPQDFDAEQAVLGSILLEPEAAHRAFQIVNPTDFYRGYHQQIAAAMVRCQERGEPIDLVTVSGELRRRGELEAVGGGEYLTALIGEVPTAAHVARYAGLVVECSIRRQTIAAAASIMQGAYDGFENVDEFLRTSSDLLAKPLRERVRTEGRLESMAERASALQDMVAAAGTGKKPLSPARLGIPSIDEFIGPLADHGIIPVKGNTGSGKTHFVLNALMATATELKRRGDPGQVVVFSFESQGMYERRMAAWIARMNNEDLRRGFDGADDDEKWGRWYDAVDELEALPIWLSERKNTQEHIESQFMEALRRGPIALAIIDYWQAMKKPKGRQLTEEYTAATNTFRDLLDDVKVPGLIPSQVTESPGFKGQPAGPGISKGSTDIQDSATMIIRLRGDTLTCEKNRHGPEFSARKVHIEKETSRVYTEEEWAEVQARRQPPVQHWQESGSGDRDWGENGDIFGK